MTQRKHFSVCVCTAQVGVSYRRQWEFSMGMMQVKDSSSGTNIKVKRWSQI